MRFLSIKRVPARQSFWRAVLGAVVAYALVVIALLIIYWALRPFVWAAIYMEPYRPPPGPYQPGSGEWLFMQGLGFGASMAEGSAAAYWSQPKSKSALSILIAVSLVSLLFTQFPFETSVFRNAIYALHGPLGIVIGAVLLKRWQNRGLGKL